MGSRSSVLPHPMNAQLGLDLRKLQARSEFLGPLFMYCEPFLSGICGVVRCIILLEWSYHKGGCLVFSNVWVGGTCQSNICINARTQSFPAKHCIVTRWSLLFTSFANGFNVVVYWCKVRARKRVAFILGVKNWKQGDKACLPLSKAPLEVTNE